MATDKVDPSVSSREEHHFPQVSEKKGFVPRPLIPWIVVNETAFYIFSAVSHSWPIEQSTSLIWVVSNILVKKNIRLPNESFKVQRVNDT